MLYTTAEIINYCEKTGISLPDYVLEDEVERTGESREEILDRLSHMVDVMHESASRHLDQAGETRMNLISGNAKKMMAYGREGEPISGRYITELMAYAFSTMETNASMGRICAAPTAGSSGILPAVFEYYRQHSGASKEELVQATLTAAAVGYLIGYHANFAGSEGGCQAECGSAAAMAAGALVQLKGGSIDQVFDAASIALMNIMGLICDPIGGMVEFPCGFRNASGAVNAMLSADMVLGGISFDLPFEEVCQAMQKVGRSLPEELRETGRGGVAGTPTGLRIYQQFRKKMREEEEKRKNLGKKQDS